MTTGKSKIFKSIGVGALAAAVAGSILPAADAFAAEDNKIDLKANGSIRIEFTDNFGGEEKSIPDAGFDLYFVGDIDEYGNITFTDEFAKGKIDLEASEDAVSNAIYSYATTTSEIRPIMSGSTDARGNYTFSGLKVGAYLLVPDKTVKYDKYTYSMNPSYFTVPSDLQVISSETVGGNKKNISNTDVNLYYNLTVHPKKERTEEGTETDVTSIEAIKVWEDENNQAGLRPESITVKLWEKNKETQENIELDTKQLSASNDWRYKWTDLDASKEYLVTEVDVPEAYSQSVVSKPDSATKTAYFSFTNRYTPPTTTTENIKNTTEGGSTTYTTRQRGTLPYTGMLWWPVPFLAAGGLALILIGVAGKKRAKKNMD